MLMGVYLHVNHLLFSQGAIHKRRLLKGGGRGGVKNCRFYLVKSQLRGREGAIKSKKWADVVYGWPPSHLTFPSNSMAARGFWQAPGKFFFLHPTAAVCLVLPPRLAARRR